MSVQECICKKNTIIYIGSPRGAHIYNNRCTFPHIIGMLSEEDQFEISMQPIHLVYLKMLSTICLIVLSGQFLSTGHNENVRIVAKTASGSTCE